MKSLWTILVLFCFLGCGEIENYFTKDKNNEISSLKQDVSSLKQEISSLEWKLKQKEIELAECGEKENKISSLEKDISVLNQELKEKKIELKACEGQLDDWDNPIVVDPDAELAKKYAQAIDYTNPITRDYAIQLAAKWPGKFHIGQICEIYDHLYKNWRYVNDPWGVDFISPASRTIQANLAGDCDDFAVLMAAMIAAIGGSPRIIIAWNNDVGHAYAEVFMGDEANLKECAKTIFDRYKIFDPIHYHKEASGDCWLNLDWSAKFPGGTFFSATRELAVSLDGTYKVYKAK
jgi:hypothetical protein